MGAKAEVQMFQTPTLRFIPGQAPIRDLRTLLIFSTACAKLNAIAWKEGVNLVQRPAFWRSTSTLLRYTRRRQPVGIGQPAPTGHSLQLATP